jgi:hypothetical protein
MRIVVLAIAGLLAIGVVDSTLAVSKKSRLPNESNSFMDQGQCLGGACQAVNPDRIPSPQNLYRGHRKTRKHRSVTNE